jgi:polyisoprenoid-binding protein YceI
MNADTPEKGSTITSRGRLPEGWVQGVWQLDTAHTEIGFSVKHMMVSRVRGRFSEFTGTVTTGPSLADSHVEVQVKVASITTGNETRDNHLRSGDFFDLENHPLMTFSSTRVVDQGSGYVVEGDLTIRGVARPVTLSVELGGFGPDGDGGMRAGFTAVGKINRHDFGVSWNHNIDGGGVFVSDVVDLSIEAEAILQR